VKLQIHRVIYFILGKKKTFLVPLLPNIVVKQGKAEFIGTSQNFYNITPPPMPKGWNVSFSEGYVDKIAEININYLGKTAAVKLDSKIFNNKDIPEGCKVFAIFHEIGHLIHGPDEASCDKFAFYHALRAGVSPFLCYVMIRAYMPEHYAYRIISMYNNLLENLHLKHDIDE
jgi:hypothetical protein